MRRGAVVDKAMLAEDTLATEGLDIYRDTVARLYAFHVGSSVFYHTNHFMSNGNAGNSSWHSSVLDVKVACADASKGHAHDGIGRLL